MSSRRIFAIIPAAGHSQRMREPKLLLPWGDSTIIDCVLRAWCESNVTHVVIVLRKDDLLLSNACEKWSVDIVRPEVDPRDMKASIQCGLTHLAEMYEPTNIDQWMISPADLPQLTSALINRLIRAGENQPCVTAPRFRGRQGHPVLVPWALSSKVFTLRENEGLNRILEGREINFLDLPAEQYVADVDTPEQYNRLKDAQD